MCPRIFCRFELLLKMRVNVMNVENAGREEKFFEEWERCVCVAVECITYRYPFYGMCILQNICNMFCSNVCSVIMHA